MQTSQPGLELRDVTKSYGAVEAVRGVDLQVGDGEFLTILGPSGSGKSTILKMIAGFENVTAGAVLLAGTDVSRMPAAKRNIGMVFQSYALFPHLNASENIAYGLKVRRWSAERRRARVSEMLELVGLEGMGKRLPRELSGGQQQRVALARALAFHPRLLLMDEPLGALDRDLRIRMAGELRRIHRDTGTTVVYVTHDREEALTLSDRIAIMMQGRIDSLATPERLYRTPPTSFAASFFGGHNVVQVDRPRGSRGSGDVVKVSLFGKGLSLPRPADLALDEEAVRVSIPTSGFHLDAAAAQSDLPVSVLVDQVVYMGDSTRATVTGPDGVSLQMDFAGHRLADLVPGSSVKAWIDTETCVLVADSSP